MSKSKKTNIDFSQTKEQIDAEIAFLKKGGKVDDLVLRRNSALKVIHNPGPAFLLKPDEKVKMSANVQVPPARKVERNAADTQIKAIKADIETNLKQIARLVSIGRLDKAGIVCEIVTRQRLRLTEVTEKYLAILEQEPKPEVAVNRRPGSKVVRKIKRYARWSDNPKSRKK